MSTHWFQNKQIDWSSLFSYIGYFDKKPETKWSGSEELPDGIMTFPYPLYSKEVDAFIELFYSMDISDKNYLTTIKEYGLEANHVSFGAHIGKADFKLLLAMLTCYMRQERFCDGIIAEAIKNGNLAGILRRLRDVIVRDSNIDL